MKNSIAQIVKLTKECHTRVNQSRKYTGDPYDIHPAEVASMAAAIWEDYRNEVPLHVFLAVAWGHDLIEDTNCSYQEIRNALVDWTMEDIQATIRGIELLTDPCSEALNREQINELQARRLQSAPRWVQGLKLCDNYCNIRSIGLHDPDFVRVYLLQKEKTYDKFTNDHTLIKSFIDPMIEKLKYTLESQRKCVVNKCSGALVERRKDVHYVDHHGVIQRAKDIQGLHCTQCTYVEVKQTEATKRLNKFAKTNPTIRIDTELELNTPTTIVSIPLTQLNKHIQNVARIQESQFFYRVSRDGCQLVRYLGNKYDLPDVVQACLLRFRAVGTTKVGTRLYRDLNPKFFVEKEKFVEQWSDKDDQGYKVERVSLQDLIRVLGHVPNVGITESLLASRSLITKINQEVVRRLK